MPLIPFEDEELIAASTPPLEQKQSNDQKPFEPTFGQEIRAAWEQENLIGSALNSEVFNSGDRHTVDDDFDLFEALNEDGIELSKLPKEQQDAFLDVHNPRHYGALKMDIEREQENRRIQNAGGWSSVALNIGMGVADPTILVPGGMLAKTAKAAKIGYSTVKSARNVSIGAATGTAIQEGGLHLTQQLRTGEESAIAIGGSVVLGGLFGAGVSKLLTKAEYNHAVKLIEADFAADVPNPKELAETIVTRAQSVGAAHIDDIKLDDLEVGGPAAAKALANATAAVSGLNPGVRTMLSPSVKTREIYARMVDNPIYTELNMRGETLGSDAENMMKLHTRGKLGSFLTARNKHFKDMRKSGVKMTKGEFNKRVGRAMRRGDVDPENEFISKAAQDARSKVTEALLKEAQSVGLLGDVKVTTAPSYFHRLWNVKNLNANEFKFKTITRKWLSGELDKVEAAQGSKLPDFVNEADREDYVDEIANSIFESLTGRNIADVPDWIVPTERGPLKGRTFKIQDELIEEFLEDDAELVLRRYTRVMGADVELARKFGNPDMKEQLDEVRQSYQELRDQAGANKEFSNKDKSKILDRLAKREKEDLTNLEAFRDLLRGTYRAAEDASIWGRAVRVANSWNYIRLLGGVTMTSLTDVSSMLRVHGMRATMSEGLPHLIKAVRGVSLSVNEARELGAVTEVILQSRFAELAELHDPYALGSPFERMMSNMSSGFSKFTGLGHWNDIWKGVNSVMTQNRILRNVSSGDFAKLDKFEKSFMGFMAIDQPMANRIAVQFNKHGTKDGTALVANSHLWDDKIARDAYAAALNKDIDRTIITPGIADKPLWARTNAGKLITQFKSFGLASHQRVLISGLQERQSRLAQAMVTATSLGMLVAYLKFVERGDTDRANALLKNPGLWIADGVDRTGYFFLPFELSNTAEKLGSPIGIKSGIQTLAGDEDRGLDVSRFASRNKLGAVLGPSAGMFTDFATIAEQLSRGDLKRSGANAIIRQIPGGTLPGARSLLHIGIKPGFVEAIE